VGTLEKYLGASADATKTLADGALATLGRIVKFDTVEEDQFKSPGWTFVVSPIVHNTRCTRARHGALTNGATYDHGRSRSTRRRIHFEPGRCL
jgi:hypothetical protein